MVNGGRQKQMLQRVDGRLKVRWVGWEGGGWSCRNSEKKNFVMKCISDLK